MSDCDPAVGGGFELGVELGAVEVGAGAAPDPGIPGIVGIPKSLNRNQRLSSKYLASSGASRRRVSVPC